MGVIEYDSMNYTDGPGKALITVQLAQEMTNKANLPKRIVDEKFMAMAKTRIELSAKKGNSWCAFQLPKFEVGTPVYDVVKVRNKILKKLAQEGWEVKAIHPHGLEICWNKKKRVSFAML